MRGSGPRTAYALAALCCTVCAALSRAWLFGSVRMACTGFFLAAAAFCLWGCADGPLRLRLRAACKGDFAAVQAAVYPTHCRWHQNGEPYRLEHADLMGAWELPDGFVLQWEGPPSLSTTATHKLCGISFPAPTACRTASSGPGGSRFGHCAPVRRAWQSPSG